MKTVGVKRLKDKLSNYLRHVRRGETVLITDRNVIIAQITQPQAHLKEAQNRFLLWIDEEERLGRIRRGQGDGPSLRRLKSLPRLPFKVDLEKLLEETRADRF